MWYVRWAPRNQAVFEAYGETKDQAVQLLAGAWLTHNKAQAHPHRDPQSVVQWILRYGALPNVDIGEILTFQDCAQGVALYDNYEDYSFKGGTYEDGDISKLSDEVPDEGEAPSDSPENAPAP